MAKKLPEKHSDLILVALKDLEAVENNPKYKVGMGWWHKPTEDKNSNKYCTVCLAGAVMANTLGASVKKEADPSDYDEETKCKLIFLDRVRVYHQVSSIICTEEEKPLLSMVLKAAYRSIPKDDRTSYDTNPIQFKKNMEHIANELDKAGL